MQFIHKGGVSSLAFHELFSLEELSFIPQPVYAVILLYPDESEGGNLVYDTSSTSVANQEGLYFMKQHNVGNACGTIAVVHSIANNSNNIPFDKDSFLKEFIETTKNSSPIEKCAALATSEKILKASDACAREGHTALSEADDDLDYHYICFIKAKDTIYELDGMKPGPISVGPAGDGFLEEVVKHIKTNYIEKAGDKIQFNIVALAPQLE